MFYKSQNIYEHESCSLCPLKNLDSFHTTLGNALLSLHYGFFLNLFIIYVHY
jgi:hypothetical protein